MLDLNQVLQSILARRTDVPPGRAMLIGISGIDGSGKGYVTGRIAAELTNQLRIAVINIDGWLNPPQLRFDPRRPAERFYERGLRLDAMFEQLVLPLRAGRFVELDAMLADATDEPALRPHRYEFDGIDVILLEGIFLYKRRFRPHFDLAIWIDCTFETALERALARGQEGLPTDAAMRAYETTYFPAQRLHAELDRPRNAADVVIVNDPRLVAHLARML